MTLLKTDSGHELEIQVGGWVYQKTVDGSDRYLGWEELNQETANRLEKILEETEDILYSMPVLEWQHEQM
mgnify:CR=1 FL=1